MKIKKIKDYTGTRSGLLTMIRYVRHDTLGRHVIPLWEAICDCGNEIIIPGQYICNKKHCGCVCKVRAGAGSKEDEQRKALNEYTQMLQDKRDTILTEDQRRRIDEAVRVKGTLKKNAVLAVECKDAVTPTFQESFMLPCDQGEDYYY